MKGGWCVEEFLQGHVEAVQGRNKFIIMILIDDIDVNQLPDELQVYVKAKQFIDARKRQTAKDIEKIRKRLLFAMPRVPVRQLQTDRLRKMNFIPLFHRLGKYDQYNQQHGMRQHNVPIHFDSEEEEEDDVDQDDGNFREVPEEDVPNETQAEIHHDQNQHGERDDEDWDPDEDEREDSKLLNNTREFHK